MGKFISHESLAMGVWNRDHCTALPAMSTWAAELTNTNELLLLLCDRLETDYISQNAKMRRAYSGKDVAAWQSPQSAMVVHDCLHSYFSMSSCCGLFLQEMLQRRCGMFLAAIKAFEKQCPKAFVTQELAGLWKSFLDLIPVHHTDVRIANSWFSGVGCSFLRFNQIEIQLRSHTWRVSERGV